MQLIKSLLLLTLLGAGTAQAMAPIQHWTTANGARVYFVPAPELPMVDLRVVFDAGSARDEGKPGRAVLTNAMLAEGAGKLDADAIARRFDDVGARFSNDALRDMAIVSLRTLTEPALMQQAVETATLVLTQPSFPEKALERERSRILVALRNQLQSPGDTAEKAYYRALYQDHPYAHPSVGTEESIKALSREELRSHYQRYYVARNAVVAIVGALDRRGAERLAEAVVGKLPAGKAAPALPQVAQRQQAERVALNFASTQTHILMGQPVLARDDPDYFPLYVGNHVLGGSGLVSRISEEIREKRGLAYSAYSYFAPMNREGPYTLGLQTANQNADEALKVLGETLERFVAEGPTADELEQAKRNITGGYALRIDSNSDIVQYLGMIGFYGLPLDYLETFNAKVEAVTAEQIRDAFQRRVQPQRMVTVTVGAGA